jgi:hypothetical protein
MCDPRQVKYHLHALQHVRIRIFMRKVKTHCWRAAIQGRTTFTQRHNCVALHFKLVTKLAPNEPGSATDKTFHDLKSL